MKVNNTTTKVFYLPENLTSGLSVRKNSTHTGEVVQ